MVLIYILVVLKFTLIVQEDYIMLNGGAFVITTGIFRMPEWSVTNWDMQGMMQWLLCCQHVMVKVLGQFGLIMCIVLEMNQAYLHVDTMELVTIIANMIRMLQLNAQVC